MIGAAARLRTCHGDALDRFVHHPFFRAVEQRALSERARDRYFVAERHFVGAARNVFAHLLLKAPDLSSARHLVGILDGLVNAQEKLFDRIYASIGLCNPETPAPETVALADGMIRIARDGGYAEGIAAMHVAEWSYAQVGRRGAWQNAEDPMLREWFALHAEPAFLAGAAWLSEELDRVWRQEDAVAVDAAFQRAIALEVAFHHGPLQEAV